MFRKLVKYEWAAMIRSMLPVYAAVIAVSIINSLFMNVGIDSKNPVFELWNWICSSFGGIAIFLYVAVMMALGAFTVVVIVQRFYKGLLGEEGYLMFTLPVKTWQLVFSKALVSFLIGVLSAAAAVLSVGILMGAQFLEILSALPYTLGYLYETAMSYDRVWVIHTICFMLELLATLVFGCFAFFYHVYLAVSLGHLARKYKAALSVAWYIGINAILGFFTLNLLGAMGSIWNLPISISLPENGYWEIHVLGLGMMLSQVIKTVLFSIGANYILKNKLNLE